ncbi:MAG TPA: right-handed parallel beta-helix repeat-containing protein [Planctomycetota bacterium]|nr:right-handed parallel beta-helix repeat-containing protein [Planctomycetota bacterium]
MRPALFALFLLSSRAPEYVVAPDGKADNAGTKESPWDLASALGRKLDPGSTIWIRGGTYTGEFQVRLAGTEAAPIQVRGVAGERVTILNCGIAVVPGADYVWLRDLEIASNVPIEKRVTDQTGSWPKDLPGSAGIVIHAGKGCKFINLVIHDNPMGGVGWWIGSTDSEMHGCDIYNNGWKAPDRTHGHCIYVQNKEGVKTISNCILTVPSWGGSYSMHAYGSKKAFIDNFVIEDNIAYERGPFLVGGGSPSHRIRVARNYLHGVGMQIGYGAENEDCEIRDNVVPSTITIQKYKTVVDEGNVRSLPAAKAIVIPNKYDPARAHVAVYNGAKAALVPVDVSTFLKPGDGFRLLDPKDVYGKPLLDGHVDGASIPVPMAGEFAAFVLIKK